MSNQSANQNLMLLTGRKYDIDKFYTASTDGNGHYEQLPRPKISPSLEAILQGIVAEIPFYDSVADLIRDALVHRAMYLKDNWQTIQLKYADEIERELQMEEMRNITRRQAALKDYVERVGETVGKSVEVQDWDGAIAVLQGAEEKLDSSALPDGIKEPLKKAVLEGWVQVKTGISNRRKWDT